MAGTEEGRTDTQEEKEETANPLLDNVGCRRGTEGEGGMDDGQVAVMEGFSALPCEMITDSITEIPDLQSQSQGVVMSPQGPPNGLSGTGQSGQSSRVGVFDNDVTMDTEGSKFKAGAAGERSKLGVKQKMEHKQKQLVSHSYPLTFPLTHISTYSSLLPTHHSSLLPPPTHPSSPLPFITYPSSPLLLIPPPPPPPPSHSSHIPPPPSYSSLLPRPSSPPPPGECWFHFNDVYVSSTLAQALEKMYLGKESAYMLFYRRKSLHKEKEGPY